MAESFLSIIAETLLNHIISPTIRETISLLNASDLKRLEGTMTYIKAVLLDAKKLQQHNQALRLSLTKIRGVFYDAEDELKTERFSSISIPFAYSLRMGNKIKTINERLKTIATDFKRFNLGQNVQILQNRPYVVPSHRDTHSFMTFTDYMSYYYFKIHDLIHDLALNVSQEECLILYQQTISASENVRHLTFADRNQLRTPESFLKKLKVVRTLIFLPPPEELRVIENSFIDACILYFKYLRLLELERCSLEGLPNSVCTLKHLRYLNLTRCWNLSRLPKSIHKLQSLLILRLLGVQRLQVPDNCKDSSTSDSEIQPGNWNSLQFLYFYNCNSLKCLFEGMQYLSFLRCLAMNNCHELESLPRKEIEIFCCRKINFLVEPQVIEDQNLHLSLKKLIIYRAANLRDLLRLLLEASAGHLGFIQIQDCLPFRDCLKFEALPNWFQNLTSLQRLEIFNCPKLSCLPDGVQIGPRYHTFRKFKLKTKRLSIHHRETISLRNASDLRRLEENMTYIKAVLENIQVLQNPSYIVQSHRDTHSFMTFKDEDPVKWNELRNILMKLDDLHQSKIIVTTRSLAVASVMGTHNPYELKALNHQDSFASENVRHLTFADCNPLRTPQLFLKKLKGVRTIIFQAPSEGLRVIEKSFLSACILYFKYLRLLELERYSLEALPNSICTLKHLRYLNLNRCRNLSRLPKSIHKLQSLLTLRFFVVKLQVPDKLQRLINLRFLKISAADMQLMEIRPGNWSSLQLLHISNCNSLKCLFEGMQYLSSLTRLEISVCDELESLPRSLKHLPKLEEIEINFCRKINLLMEPQVQIGSRYHTSKRFTLKIKRLSIHDRDSSYF
ncbi:hypothetical protein CXB51_028936 [Gossypium anomalum]|uniref:Rx N-terminal domain-containing protein n=1 Tax=Gossypium anomalum TaxID=47600 RepID=A0A8J5YF81_9ROSI|nr:hypothetical protein CXB51_028936 [Gossypium anomalum]